MVIGLDASGDFTAVDGFEPSAVAAATIPTAASSEIAEWTRERLAAWGREEIGELHAAALDWPERLETCEMLGSRGDVYASVIITTNTLLCSPEAVAAHRRRQLVFAEASRARATTDDGRVRGQRACRLLAGKRIGRNRLSDGGYIHAATVPRALVGAVQRAFCFYSDDSWRSDMAEVELVMDDETPATVRYVTQTLLPTIGGDERFRIVTPAHWRNEPVHPLLARAQHPDGDGLWPQHIVGETIRWVSSHDEVAVQVADMAAWVVCRAITRPGDPEAREAFEMLRSVLVGEQGRCFEVFSLCPIGPEEEVLLGAHLHSHEEPPEWLVRLNTA